MVVWDGEHDVEAVAGVSDGPGLHPGDAAQRAVLLPPPRQCLLVANLGIQMKGKR